MQKWSGTMERINKCIHKKKDETISNFFHVSTKKKDPHKKEQFLLIVWLS